MLEIEKGKVTDNDLAGQSVSSSQLAEEIRAVQGKGEEIRAIRAPGKVSKEELELLKDVMENVTSGVVDRYSRVGVSAHSGTKLCRSLIEKDLVEPVNIPAGKARVRLLWLREKGKEALRNLSLDVSARGRGGPEHEYWKERVAQYLRNLGYAVEIEKSIGENRTIDLVARKNQEAVAIEIESGQSDVEENVRKCLAAEYQRVIVVITSRRLVPAVWRKLQIVERLPLDRVEVQDVQAFLLKRNGKM